MAADPTYPLYPMANILAAALLLIVFSTSAIRRSWNLGLAFLCFWLFFEALTDGINGIVWSNNADAKLYVYCDIVSRLQIASYVVKPMATLTMMRHLYKIAGLQSSVTFGTTTRRWEWLIDWTAGVLIPLLVAGPFYYIVQGVRFNLLEGFGCMNATNPSVLSILLLELWGIVPPLYCVAFYYPRVVRVFYLHSREMDRFMRSAGSAFITRSTYLRILVIASIDILLTLPMGIVVLTFNVVLSSDRQHLPFYSGWAAVNTSLVPPGLDYKQLQAMTQGRAVLVHLYFAFGTTPVLAFTIFGLFGLTRDARESYWRAFSVVAQRFGWHPTAMIHKRRGSTLGSIEFGTPPQERTSSDDGQGPTVVTFTPSSLSHESVVIAS